MKELRQDSGLAGLSRCFKEAVSQFRGAGKVLYVGTPFTCLPFAEFLSYAIRDLPLKVYFAPNGKVANTVELRQKEGYGFVAGDIVEENNFDVVVLLGGLAMPKARVDPYELKKELLRVSKLEYVIGFCFQSVMMKPEWIKEFGFRYFIDANLSRVLLMEELA